MTKNEKKIEDGLRELFGKEIDKQLWPERGNEPIMPVSSHWSFSDVLHDENGAGVVLMLNDGTQYLVSVKELEGK